MNTDKKLAHFVLQTGQLAVLRDWYLKVLGPLLHSTPGVGPRRTRL
jgi:hypothetical protein